MSNLKDLSSYFGDSNISIEITSWKQSNKDFYMIFLPLNLDNEQQSCLQKVNGKISKVDFILSEIDNKLIFQDITTNRAFHFDTSELHLLKFQFIGHHAKATFVKEPFVNLGIDL